MIDKNIHWIWMLEIELAYHLYGGTLKDITAGIDKCGVSIR